MSKKPSCNMRVASGAFWAILFSLSALCFGAHAAVDSLQMRIVRDTLFAADFVIPARAVCVIEPGVTVSFGGYHRLVVEGVLLAEGSAERPVLFTAANRARGALARPGWKGIEIGAPPAFGRFVHCRIEGAYRTMVWESAPVFDSCEFVGNHYALYCAKKARPHISNSVFYRNRIALFSDFASPMLLDNRITDNVIGLYLQVNSDGIIGRNVITNNETDIKSQNAFGDNVGSSSLHQLWNVVNQLY